MRMLFGGNSMLKVLAVSVAMLCFASAAFASSEKGVDKVKRGILVVAFGTSVPEARGSINAILEAAKKTFPGTEVRLAFTSNIIRRKLAKGGENIPTPFEALAAMNDDGFTHVYVQPTHVIPGEEYDDLKSLVKAVGSIKRKYSFRHVALGKPLMGNMTDCGKTAELLVKRFADVPKDTAVVLMGHGSLEHPAHAVYSQLQLFLNRMAPGRFFIGTVETHPAIEDVQAGLKAAGYKKVLLSPLMIVAGDHAKNDLADKDDPESWYSVLKKDGYQVSTRLDGLGSDGAVQSIFMDSLKKIMEK